MKFIFTFLAFHLILIVEAQIVISGKIKNYDGKTKISYNPIVDGIAPPYHGFYSVSPTPNGDFKISFTNKGYGTMTLSFDGLGYYFFCAENSRINLIIDQAKINIPKKTRSNYFKYDAIKDSVKQLATVSIDGDYLEINKYYNHTLRSLVVVSVDGFDFAHLIKNADSPRKVISIMDSLTQAELDQIKNLGLTTNNEKSDNLITEDIKRFLENEVRAFYGTTFLNGMDQKLFMQFRQLQKDSLATRTIYNSEWERLIENYCATVSKKSGLRPTVTNTMISYKHWQQRFQIIRNIVLIIQAKLTRNI